MNVGTLIALSENYIYIKHDVRDMNNPPEIIAQIHGGEGETGNETASPPTVPSRVTVNSSPFLPIRPYESQVFSAQLCN